MKIRAIEVKPGKVPEEVTIDNSLKSLQEALGGLIEAVYPYDDSACIICNESGKLDGLPLNRALYRGSILYDIVAGTFYIVGTKGNTFCSLTNAQIRKYSEMYAYPELFFSELGRMYTGGNE